MKGEREIDEDDSRMYITSSLILFSVTTFSLFTNFFQWIIQILREREREREWVNEWMWKREREIIHCPRNGKKNEWQFILELINISILLRVLLWIFSIMEESSILYLLLSKESSVLILRHGKKFFPESLSEAFTSLSCVPQRVPFPPFLLPLLLSVFVAV